METRKIVIEIAQGQQAEKPKVFQDETKEKNTLPLASSVVVNQAYKQVKGLVKNYATYSINKHFMLTENYIMQQKLDNALQIINRGVSFGTTLAGGFMLGGMAGAVVGTVGWVANEALAIHKRVEGQQRSLNQTNSQLLFSQTRAGLVDGGRQ